MDMVLLHFWLQHNLLGIYLKPWLLQVTLLPTPNCQYKNEINLKVTAKACLLFVMPGNSDYLIYAFSCREIWLPCATFCTSCPRKAWYFEAWGAEAQFTLLRWGSFWDSFQMWWLWCLRPGNHLPFFFYNFQLKDDYKTPSSSFFSI